MSPLGRVPFHDAGEFEQFFLGHGILHCKKSPLGGGAPLDAPVARFSRLQITPSLITAT